MAREQFMDWRDKGPGTDLYALRCVAHAMVSGTPPFQATNPIQYAGLHLYGEPQPLPSLPGFPRGFGDWVARLLQKEPRDRFDCAAQAAQALADLRGPAPTAPGPTQTLTTLSLPALRDSHTLPMGTRRPAPPPAPSFVAERDPATTTLKTSADEVEPLDWRDNTPPPAEMSLVGAGLGLYEWRAIPLVDRTTERDRVWRSVLEVRRTGRTRVVLLRGGAGLGKSRLAEWIGQRCLELGLTTVVLRAEHEPIPGERHGMPAAVADYLRCDRADVEDVRARSRAVLERRGVDDEAAFEALVEFVLPGSGRGVRYRTPTERYIALRTFLGRLCGRRPVVIQLNDLHYGSDTLGLLQFLTSTQADRPLPLLVLCTVRDDLLRQRPLEHKLIDELITAEGVDIVDVAPLADGDHDELVRLLLRLEGDLAQQVRERTGGNPLFAIQLMGDWVARRVLDIGETGFELRRGEHAEIPGSIRHLWHERLQQVLGEDAPELNLTIEVAAALGREVQAADWAEACAQLRIQPRAELVDRLIRADLAEPREQGWAFCHGMFHETIRHDARAGGRWVDTQLACVEMLRSRGTAAGAAERIGRHLIEADCLEESLAPLLQGGRARLATSDYHQAGELFDLIAANLDRLGVDPTDDRWGTLWSAQARCAIGLGDFEAAGKLAARTAEQARRHRWKSLYPVALRYQAVTLEKQGDLGLAETVMFRAQVESTRVGDREGDARCLLHLATIARLLGDLVRATEYGEDALAAFRELQDAHGTADSLSELGSVHVVLGQGDRARAFLDDALASFQEIGNLFGQARTRNALAEILRQQGDLTEAERQYEQAQRLYERVGSPDRLIPHTNRALLLVQRGAYQEAHASLEAGLAIARREGRRLMQAYLHTALLPCAAWADDWAALDRHLSLATELLSEMGTNDPDLAQPAQLAGELALERGEAERALGALGLALDQWRALGQEERVAQVEVAMAACTANSSPGLG